MEVIILSHDFLIEFFESSFCPGTFELLLSGEVGVSDSVGDPDGLLERLVLGSDLNEIRIARGDFQL